MSNTVMGLRERDTALFYGVTSLMYYDTSLSASAAVDVFLELHKDDYPSTKDRYYKRFSELKKMYLEHIPKQPSFLVSSGTRKWCQEMENRIMGVVGNSTDRVTSNNSILLRKINQSGNPKISMSTLKKWIADGKLKKCGINGGD